MLYIDGPIIDMSNTRPTITQCSFSWLERSIRFPIGRMIDFNELGDIYRTVCTKRVLKFLVSYLVHCSVQKGERGVVLQTQCIPPSPLFYTRLVYSVTQSYANSF